MKKRIAKKIERNIFWHGRWADYSDAQRCEARRIVSREMWRRLNDERTMGWRFGKWDPCHPLAPWEPPF